MARVKFTKDFDYKPKPSVTIAYKAGREYTVRRECADQAIAVGRGTEIHSQSSDGASGDRADE
jgi:hypothetical protein